MGGYSFIMKSVPRRMLNPDESSDYVGGEAILARMEKAAWVKPSIRQHKLTRYDQRDLDAACDRLKAEELPA